MLHPNPMDPQPSPPHRTSNGEKDEPFSRPYISPKILYAPLQRIFWLLSSSHYADHPNLFDWL